MDSETLLFVEKMQEDISVAIGLLVVAVGVLLIWLAFENYEVTIDPDDDPEDKGPTTR